MKDIDLPESVIAAGRKACEQAGHELTFGNCTDDEYVSRVFTAMARALVEHDRENDIVAVVRLREDGSLETLYGSPPP